MNANFFRTILNWLTGGSLIAIFTTFLGCKSDDPLTAVIEPTVCTAPWMPVEWQAMAGFAFVVVGFLVKMMGSGSVAQNIAAPIVPVVPPAEAKVGVVTEAQVAAPGAKK